MSKLERRGGELLKFFVMHPHWPSFTRGITQNLAIVGHFFTNVLCISHYGFLFIYLFFRFFFFGVKWQKITRNINWWLALISFDVKKWYNFRILGIMKGCQLRYLIQPIESANIVVSWKLLGRWNGIHAYMLP
jgi:hypothetical protein